MAPDLIHCNDWMAGLIPAAARQLKIPSLFSVHHIHTMEILLSEIEDPEAPMLFWPSRLDPVQKGCQLLSDILYQVISTYWEDRLQVVFVADGDYQQVFKDIARFHSFENRVAVHDFDLPLEHLGYGAADFVLMPSRFEPCGLPQMIGAIYGALPIAHERGRWPKNGQFNQRKKLCQTGVSYEHIARFVIVIVLVLVLVLEASEPLSVSRTSTSTTTSTI